MDAVRFAVSGAAPLSRDTIQFFHALGIPLTQVWGLTEATGVCTTTSSATLPASSVGTPLPSIEMRLGIDGEIVGRKSEMIITDEGDNISPAIIENAIAAASFLIGHVMVIGEQRPYLTALITLDEEAIAADARLAQVEPATLDVLCERPGVREAVSEAVRAANSTVSGPEQGHRGSTTAMSPNRARSLGPNRRWAADHARHS
ncbi:AMP-binding protein [Nocardia sp. NPDC058518]|uniref:AMP-binding protein n=1 Tax=Nocardia sp. NPDC058518 TaxID=3346534 RepID=UPI0036507862